MKQYRLTYINTLNKEKEIVVQAYSISSCLNHLKRYIPDIQQVMTWKDTQGEEVEIKMDNLG